MSFITSPSTTELYGKQAVDEVTLGMAGIMIDSALVPEPPNKLLFSTGKDLKLFECFGGLPTELRLKIWRETFPGPRFIFVRMKFYESPAAICKLPIALRINKESREETKRTYTLAFGLNNENRSSIALAYSDLLSNRPRIYVDFKRDTLLLPHRMNNLTPFLLRVVKADRDQVVSIAVQHADFRDNRLLIFYRYFFPNVQEIIHFKLPASVHVQSRLERKLQNLFSRTDLQLVDGPGYPDDIPPVEGAGGQAPIRRLFSGDIAHNSLLLSLRSSPNTSHIRLPTLEQMEEMFSGMELPVIKIKYPLFPDLMESDTEGIPSEIFKWLKNGTLPSPDHTAGP